MFRGNRASWWKTCRFAGFRPVILLDTDRVPARVPPIGVFSVERSVIVVPLSVSATVLAATNRHFPLGSQSLETLAGRGSQSHEG